MALIAAVLAVLNPVAAGASGTAANVTSFGFGYYGYLGNGEAVDRATPTPVTIQSFVTQVSGGGDNFLALHADGTVNGWGRNDWGQLGNAATSWRELFPQTTLVPPVVQVAAGTNSWATALDGFGKVYSWGRGDNGSLGRTAASGDHDATPAQVPGLPRITQISAGYEHALARTATGHVWAWGYNHTGQLGDPARSGDSYAPFEIPGLTGIVSVAAGGNTSYAIDTTGTVYAWGDHYGGPGAAPTKLLELPLTVKAIAATNDHALALTRDGHVWALGFNNYGQLGDGDATTTGWRPPVLLTSLSGIKQVSASTATSAAVTTSGSVYGWGANWFGQNGNGTTDQNNTPTPMSLTGVAGIASNGFASISWGTLPSSTAVASASVAAITRDTPLYTMKVSLSLGSVSCPGAVTLKVGPGLMRSKPLCLAGEMAPTSTELTFSVLDLNPRSSYQMTAVIADAAGLSTSKVGTLTTPKVPVFVAVGDSYSSGHHQVNDEYCGDIVKYPACTQPSSATTVVLNDKGYAWPTIARNKITALLNVPSRWQMYTTILAKSGAKASEFSNPATSGCIGCGESAAMAKALTAHAGSWNIVSIEGGANDADFTKALKEYYFASPLGRPWDEPVRYNCPDTDALSMRIESSASSVASSLSAVVGAARTVEPNVRIIALSYPYVADSGSTCSGEDSLVAPHHGANYAVDQLDSTIIGVSASEGINIVDLRTASGFWPTPMDSLQTTRYFGYPHPNPTGQASAANAVVAKLAG